MRTPLIAGNWKMYKTIAEAVELAEAVLRGLGDTHDRGADLPALHCAARA